MTKNPIINAFAASLYIITVASFMFFGMKNAGPDNSVLIPFAMISLFTLSAAAMGYIFLSNPLQLYLDGKKKEAVNLFVKTLLIFGVTTAIALTLVFLGLV